MDLSTDDIQTLLDALKAWEHAPAGPHLRAFSLPVRVTSDILLTVLSKPEDLLTHRERVTKDIEDKEVETKLETERRERIAIPIRAKLLQLQPSVQAKELLSS